MLAENKREELLPHQLTEKAADVAYNKATKAPLSAFYLAITAGLFIGLAFVFYVTVTTGTENVAWGLSKFAGGAAFSLGLLLIVVVGGELFTSSTLTLIAKASKRITTAQLLKNWIIVYFGNFIGATFLVFLIFFAGMYNTDHGQWGLTVLHIAQHKLHHSSIEAVSLGILCNMMVCLAVWMAFAARTITDKMFAVFLPVTMFVASGFEHSIANMFMVPSGILIQQFAPAEFWLAIGEHTSQYSDLTIYNFIFDNLIPVTIGNIIGGGVIVGLMHWMIYLRPMQKSKQEQ
ncbi:formate/nitrite transporter [Psychromonas ingrahamii 37]|uniref:Formate transporter FocA n=1 Tax=Psychromonas ingrahamii (strain DSM 17664 / CCUG 51855 / 37) TaxID=357804 RepID=A1SZS8_PSYIN|nr:formate transporter FocA [Psychromonas ingrahamii]ABM04993.1 formate/nitrite transporter [Psychromonas ingrahamii 37]